MVYQEWGWFNINAARTLHNGKHFPSCSEAQRFLLYSIITLFILGSTSLLKKIHSTTNQYINSLENSKWDTLPFLHWSTTLSTMHFPFEENIFCYKAIHKINRKHFPCLMGIASLLPVKHNAFCCTAKTIIFRKHLLLSHVYSAAKQYIISMGSTRFSYWEVLPFL